MSQDIDATGTGSPVALPAWFLSGNLLTLIPALDGAANSEWHLLAVHRVLGFVVAAIPGIAANTATLRRMSKDNASQPFVCVPLRFDLRSFPRSADHDYYLSVATLGGAATAYLLGLLPSSEFT